MMKALQKLLILSHRYIGIPLSFLFVIWFLSAFVMIYAGGMPRITPAMRVEAASAIDFSSINISPQQAVEIAGYNPESASLRTLLGRPTYELQELSFSGMNIFADTGEIVPELSIDESQLLASNFLDIPTEQFSFVGQITEVDQWTISNAREMPLYKFSVDDGLGTQVYVSPEAARVSIYTTTQSRLLAWLGTIPHWLYFTSLRVNQPLWYDIVVWSSGIGCVLAFIGLIMGFTQFRKVRPFKLSRAIPYQGWMRWHYILGVVFGLFMLTWAFSGLLSMEPFAWTNARGLDLDRSVYADGDLDLNRFPEFANQDWEELVDGEIKELEFSWIAAQPYYVANYSEPLARGEEKRERLHQPYYIIGQAESNSILVSANNFQISNGFDPESLVNTLANSISSADVVEYELLSEYDDYYYSRSDQIPLPVLRIKFNDPAESWVYVDPKLSQLLTMVHKWSRVERWLYSGLHSLDFAFWYSKRPLWDIGVLFLLLGGLLSSSIGLYFGVRRLKLDVQAVLNRFNGNKEVPDVTG